MRGLVKICIREQWLACYTHACLTVYFVYLEGYYVQVNVELCIFSLKIVQAVEFLCGYVNENGDYFISFRDL